MRNRKIKISGIAIAFFLSALTMSAIAQQAGPGPKCNKGEGQATCQKIPDLTEKQEAEIKVLRTEHMKTMNAQKVDLNILRAELKKLEVAENFDQKAVDSKIDEVFAIKTEMAKQGSVHRQKVRSLLTAEQKVFFEAHMGRCCGKGYGAKNSGCPRK